MKQRHQGFTLIEGLIALGIATLLVTLTVGWGRRLVRAIPSDDTQFFVMLAYLEQPDRYQYLAGDGDLVELTDHTAAHKPVRLSVDHTNTLRLSNQNGSGNLPLLQHVLAANWQPIGKTGLVWLQLIREGHTKWETTLVDFRGPAGGS